MKDPRPDCPRRLDLERLLAGDSPPAEAASLRAHLGDCPHCQRALGAMERRREAFQARHPYAAAARDIEARADGQSRRRFLLTHLVPATATLLALVVLAVNTFPGAGPPGLRTKGDVHLEFYVQRGDDILRGEPGGTYHEGDRIQFSYSSGFRRFLFLVSLDNQGRVSNFNYRGSEESVLIVPGNDRVLEGSIILDDTVGPERIFGIFTDQPLHFEDIERVAQQAYDDVTETGLSVRELDLLPLPHSQASILLEKE